MCKRYLIIFISIVLVSCATTQLIPTEQDLILAPVHGSGSDLASLNKGYNLYVNKCGACHYLYRPAKFEAEKWKRDMPEMSERAKITKEEQRLILNYLLTKHEAAQAKHQ